MIKPIWLKVRAPTGIKFLKLACWKNKGKIKGKTGDELFHKIYFYSLRIDISILQLIPAGVLLIA